MSKTLRFLLLPALLLCAFAATQAQNVSWKNKVEELGDGKYRIVLTAQIPERFHMYDMGPYDAMGPNATIIEATPVSGAQLAGAPQAITAPHRYYDDIYELEIGTYEGTAEFAQDILLTEPEAEVRIYLEWMICDDTSCLPLSDDEITVKITGTPAAADAVAAAAATTPAATDAQSSSDAASASAPVQKDAAGGGSLWSLIIEAILWGFAMLLTPCVFPMVPMTVSFFMKGSGSPARGRFNAFMYGLFIVVLYTLPIAAIILITRFVGGDAVTADIFNWLATHWLPNVIFFLVFMIFAASFFGAFEITLPSWMVNKSDSKADNKSLGGIFFLALTLVLVSFSCTGPIVGSVLIKSTSGGEFWSPIITMFAFSVAFALPFTIFAFFPSMLKNLPKSGGWLNSVKVVLGFVELALGLKFLSVADQTYHWGILDREIYLALWIAIFTLLGLYLIGKLKFKYDSELKYISVGRLVLAIIVFAFVAYMLPGMWGAPLKGLSGYMPPIQSQDFVLGAYTGPTTSQAYTGTSTMTSSGNTKKYADFLAPLPYGIDGYYHYGQAMEAAVKADKPLFIDFTGHGCVNCREMEQRVWSDPTVQELLRNEFVVVSLYGDDKKNVPEEDWVTLPNGKVLKGLGRINSNFMAETYGVNAQPAYIIVDHTGKPLLPVRGYNLNIEEYITFLKTGLAEYQKARQ